MSIEAPSPRTRWAVIVFLFLCAVCWAAWKLSDVLMPFYIAFGLSYAFEPLMDWMERHGLRRRWGATLIVLGIILSFILLIAVIVPPFIKDTVDFANNFPDYAETAIRKVSAVGQSIGLPIPQRDDLLDKGRGLLKKITPTTLVASAGIAARVFNRAGSALFIILNVFVVPLFMFFLLRDMPFIRQSFFKYVPPRHLPGVRRVAGKLDEVWSGFIRGQLSVASILAVVFSVGLVILRVKFGLFIGFLSGFLNMIPYVGQLTGVVLSLIMAVVDFQGWGRFLAIPIFFAIVNFLEGNFLTPNVVGNKVGLNPLESVLALLIGGKIAGFLGMLLAIPMAASLKVLYKEGLAAYRQSPLYKDI